MTDGLTSQLHAVLRLAEKIADCKVVANTPPQAEYCTTNDVLAIGSIVAKKYRLDDAYRVETGILKGSHAFTFKIPRLFFSHQSEVLGSWNVMERAAGATLAAACPKGQNLRRLVEHMIAALVEFEERSGEIISGPSFRWRWEDSVSPLVTELRRNGDSDAAEALVAIASACDRLSECIDAVPCFDLFARNIIWSDSGAALDVTFVDFDKAGRLVPAGEQLSHIAVIPGLREAMGDVASRYAQLAGRPLDSVRRIVDIACFFRALAGVRDSLPWETFGGSETREDPHAGERNTVLHYSITEAERWIPAICASADAGIEGDLHLVLSGIRNLKRPQPWR